MPRRAVRAREYEEEDLPQTTLLERVGWVVLVALWTFLVVSLASFDSADWPSHTVAVHNQPTRNLCGIGGGLVAYHGYHVIGVGSWVILAGAAAFLAMAAARREMCNPLVRAFGLLLMAVSVSGGHALLAPELGSLAGAPAGLVGGFIVGELGPRFSTIGTFLILLGGLAIGSIVAIDRLVLAGLRGVSVATRGLLAWRPDFGWLARLRARPEAATVAVPAPRRGRPGQNAARIDPDAGGIGATDSFDPEEDEEDDETEEDIEPQRQRLTPEELRDKIALLPVRMGGTAKIEAKDDDIPRQESFKGYKFPTLDLLQDPQSNYSKKMEAFVRKQAEQLEEALETYGIDGEVAGIESGPVVTLYSVQLAPGTKVARVQAVAADLARSLRAHNIRIVPNMVGKTTVGIEVPNLHKEKVRLKELMSGGHAEGMLLPMFLGKDVSGEPLVADLTRMPHMLIAGTTGSGKSVCINTIIMSWLYTKRPDELKLILVDPKMVELSQFQDIPHLMCPVVNESSKAVAILKWAMNKMEERYELLHEASVRNVASYNRLTEDELYERFEPANDLERAKIPKKLPYIVFIIDELADLIMTHKEAEHAIVRIAQKARAVGIHLIVATQRPQANVVTGLIKSNMPCRISFQVASAMDSRIVLDHKGAELLLGQGDMLILTPHTSHIRRAQGTLVVDIEIRRVARFLRSVAAPSFERSLLSLRPPSDPETEDDAPVERDPLFDEAVKIIIESGRGSVSLLQRRLAIGYTRASRLVDQMYMAGILGDHKGSVARQVLITLDEWEQMKAMEDAAEAEGTLFEEEEDEEEDEEDVSEVDESDLDETDLDDSEDEELDEDLEDEEEEKEEEEEEEEDYAEAEPPLVETFGEEETKTRYS